MPISKRFTRDLLLLASDHAKLFGAVSECKLPGSPWNDGVDKIDNFPSHQHVLFSVGFLIADAFLGKQNLRDMIPWDVAPEARQSRGFAPGHLPFAREKIIQIELRGIGVRRISHH